MTRKLTIAFGAMLLFFAATPAHGQVQPPPVPIPAPPPETEPVFKVIAPVASPLCGNAVLVIAIAPGLVEGQLGMPLPINLIGAIGPAFLLCGSVPTPSGRYLCAADAGAQFAFDYAAANTAGAPLPVEVRPVGPVVEEIVLVQSNVPPSANAVDLAELAVGVLQCTPIGGTAPPAPAPAAEAPAEEAPPDVTDLITDLGLGDFSPGDSFLGDGGLALPEVASGVENAAPELRPVAGVSGPRFSYPVVFLLPLVLLLVGGYLGWALTRPVESSQA